MRLQKWSQTEETLVWHTNSRCQDDRKFSNEIILIDAKVKKVKAAIRGKISLPTLDIFMHSYLKKKTTMAKTVLMYRTEKFCFRIEWGYMEIFPHWTKKVMKIIEMSYWKC